MVEAERADLAIVKDLLTRNTCGGILMMLSLLFLEDSKQALDSGDREAFKDFVKIAAALDVMSIGIDRYVGG